MKKSMATILAVAVAVLAVLPTLASARMLNHNQTRIQG